MRVAVTGATSVLGQVVVPALVAAGHDVVGLARTSDRAELVVAMGATVRVGSIYDDQSLVDLLTGCHAVCNVASHVASYPRSFPWSWHVLDRLRTEGVRRVLDAARTTGVRRVVQESVSHLYADHGDDWINERSSLSINRATEPASVGESLVQDFTCESRTGVVLRFGAMVGDDRTTRSQVRASRAADGWAHVVHPDDVGTAVVAAMTIPSGVYNVGAAPVHRSDFVRQYAAAGGHDRGDLVGLVTQRLAAARAEPLGRSLRVSSTAFSEASGWMPQHDTFDTAWLTSIGVASP